MDHSLYIGLLVEERYLAQAQPTGVSVALRARGHRIRQIVPEQAAFELGKEDWLEGLDIVLARGRSWPVLALLTQAEALWKPTINGHVAVASVHNKAEMVSRMHAARLPMPRSFLGRVDQLARQVGAADYPLIVKPIFGDNGQGLCLIHNRAELVHLPWPEPFALAQSYLPNDGYDLKLYGIGDAIWAVRKPATFGNPPPASAHSTQPLTPTPAMYDLGRRCRRLFGLDLYGVDCLETRDGLVVIEVNDFPNYSGVPEANEHLADYIEQRAYKARR